MSAAAFRPTAVRPPAVAGTFYSDRPARLAAEVERFLGDAEGARRPGTLAVIAPHAGYVYSGPIAGSAFAAVEPRAAAIRRVLLLGPAHFVPVRGLALPDAGALETPLGTVPVDLELASEALALDSVSVSAGAHAPEHSLEVELPFLQVLLGEFSVLPLVVGLADVDEVAEVIDRLWTDADLLVVVSSDLSHYHSYETARRLDRETSDAILALEAPIAADRACGALPIGGLLVAARRRGLAAELLDLRSSGDTAGDRDRVVGYGAFAFGPA